jgi:hypothetical protein
MRTSRCIDDACLDVGYFVWGRADRANQSRSSFEYRVSGERKYTIAQHVSVFVAQGDSNGVRKKISTSSCRGFHMHVVVVPVGGIHSANVREA